MYMYVYVCVCMFMYMCVCIFYVYVCIHMYMNVMHITYKTCVDKLFISLRLFGSTVSVIKFLESQKLYMDL